MQEINEEEEEKIKDEGLEASLEKRKKHLNLECDSITKKKSNHEDILKRIEEMNKEKREYYRP